MRKFFILIAAVATLGFAACTPEEAPKQPGEETPAPTADFTYVADGLSVSFTSNATNAVSYKWAFGDGETAKTQNAKHEYAEAGEYDVVLTVANADGVTAKAEKKVVVAGEPKAYFSATVLQGREGAFGKIVRFDASSSANVDSITWDFGDGTSSAEFVVDHKFPEYSTYTVKATVSNASGATDTFESEVTLVAQNELLSGGGMGEDDAQYWTFITTKNPEWFGEDQFPLEDSWAPTFGYTGDKPAMGEGACFRAAGEKQLTQASFNFTLYQAVELEAGDSLNVNVALKWAENSCNNGLFWIGICESEEAVKTEQQNGETAGEGHWVEMFNYWAAAGTAEWGDGGASIPAYDGDLNGTEAWIAANTELEMGYSGAESTGFRVEKGGTYYFFINYRNVWGNYWGVDVLIDNASLKIIL